MPPLLTLIAALVLNYIRHRQHKSTICSTCRKYLPPVPFIMGWAGLTAWLLPHYCKPLLKKIKEIQDEHECK